MLPAKKERETLSENQSPSCNFLKTMIYIGGKIKDSALYLYEKDTLKQVKLDLESIHYIYSGNKIVRKNYINKFSTLPNSYDTIYYNTQGFAEKMEHYKLRFGVWVFDLEHKFEFTHNNGKIVSINYFEVSNGSLYKIQEQYFIYDNDNIIKNTILTYNSPSNPMTRVFTYTYAGSPNPLPLLFRKNLLNLVGYNWNYELLPMFLSRNVLTEYGFQGSKGLVNYSKDSNNLVHTVGSNSTLSPIIGFRYSCP